MSEQIIPQVQQAEPETDDDDDEVNTEAEFRVLFTDAQEGKQRLLGLAMASETAGDAISAKIYREIAGTVMTLFADLTAASGGAIVNVEDDLDYLRRNTDGRTTSALLETDANQFLALFDQYLRLLDGLTSLVPPGSDGDAQRDIFATIRRMTVNMVEFTKSLIVTGEDEEEDEEEDETPDGQDERDE